jgi:hypothetical protein
LVISSQATSYAGDLLIDVRPSDEAQAATINRGDTGASDGLESDTAGSICHQLRAQRSPATGFGPWMPTVMHGPELP